MASLRNRLRMWPRMRTVVVDTVSQSGSVDHLLKNDDSFMLRRRFNAR